MRRSVGKRLTRSGAYKISGGQNGGQIGLGLGTIIGLSIAGMIKTGSFSLPGILLNPAVAVTLSAITGFLIGLILLDIAQGVGNTAVCFVQGLIIGIEAGLAVGGISARGITSTRTQAVVTVILEAITLVSGIQIENSIEGGFPPPIECGIGV